MLMLFLVTMPVAAEEVRLICEGTYTTDSGMYTDAA
jgi:hypothetical protein